MQKLQEETDVELSYDCICQVCFFCYFFFFTNVPAVHTAHSHRWRGSRQLHRTPTCKHHITRSNHRCISVIYYVTSAKICDTWPGRPLHTLQYRRTQPLLWAHRGRRGTVGVIVFKKKQTNKKKPVSGNTKGLQCFSCGTVGDGGAGHFRHHGKNPSVLSSCVAPFSTVFMNPNSLVSDFPLTWLSSQQLLSKKKNSSRRFFDHSLSSKRRVFGPSSATPRLRTTLFCTLK